MPATARTGRKNIAGRYELIDSLAMILRTSRSEILKVGKSMTSASLREWIETEIQFRQAA